ncbi:MAG: hypothetical protein L6Q76_04050 [Polyangiaceae bacterium]|nr:hypothetical protein [Polyangiaceae bacterium]
MAQKSPTTVLCPSCGAKNAASAGNRCAACGALTDGRDAPTRPGTMQGRASGGFSILWFAIALGVQAVLTAALVVGLPVAVPALDFEGSNGIIVAIPVWFLGGMLIGMISPGKTYAEPTIASFIVQVPTVLWLWKGQTVRTMPFFMYACMGLVGVLFALVGSYLGERIQMGPPPKTAD